MAQVGDGLVALPKDARTKEHLEWVAAQVIESGGESIVWIASPGARRDSRSLAQQMSEARAEEYERLIDEIATEGAGVDPRTIARWRREWRRIDRRDYFRAPGRNEARLAIDDLAARETTVGAEQ